MDIIILNPHNHIILKFDLSIGINTKILKLGI